LKIEVVAIPVIVVPIEQRAIIIIQIDLGIGGRGGIELVAPVGIAIEPLPILIGVAVQGVVLGLVVGREREDCKLSGGVIRLIDVRGWI